MGDQERMGAGLLEKNFQDMDYRGTPLIRKRTPLGPQLRPMPRVLGGS